MTRKPVTRRWKSSRESESSVGLLQGGNPRVEWTQNNPFRGETNNDGEIVIRNLPQGTHRVGVSSELWHGITNVISDPDEITEATLELQRIPASGK